MVRPRIIDADGKPVAVKLMDDSWVINECVSGHPFKPRPGVVWKHADHCSRLPVPGDELPEFMREVRDTYGNCAAIAWHRDVVLGHLVFLPRAIARERQAAGWLHFGPAAEDQSTLVVINLAFCSLSGHEFRRKGIGKALVAITLDWARENGWRRIEVYDTGGGLFPSEWYDSCVPPRPFWEGRGFLVSAAHGSGIFLDEDFETVMADNPRNNAKEQRQKEEIIAGIRRDEIAPEIYARSYDLRRRL